jgi:hypothetical protein
MTTLLKDKSTNLLEDIMKNHFPDTIEEDEKKRR